MARTLIQALAFQYAVLRGAVRAWRDSGPGRRGEQGMTTLEVLVIAGGLLALGLGAVALITSTARGRVGSVESPSSFLTT